MKLTTYTIGDVLEIKHGYAFSGEHIVTSDNGVVLVTPGNFRIGGGFQEDKCKFYKGDYPAEYVLPAETHIVTMTDLSKEIDTLGYSAIVPASERTYLHNQRIGRIVYKSHNIYPLYMHYLMRTREYQRFVANSSSGATVHHTSPEKICRYEFCAPSRAKQEEIADLLYAYDSLIENNRRQIKLLEEAAQRLYKEWFVDLRFPGHEHTPIINGIPQGWQILRVENVCETMGGGTPSTKHPEYYENGTIPWVTPTDVTRNASLVLLSPEKCITEAGLVNSSAKMVPPYSILMTSRASVGYFAVCSQSVCTNQGFIACVPKEGISHTFLLFHLLSRVPEIRLKAGGSTYPEISKSTFRQFELLVPSTAIMKAFDDIVFTHIQLIETLAQQILRLTEARDRLLPKLMSGEVEV